MGRTIVPIECSCPRHNWQDAGPADRAAVHHEPDGEHYSVLPTRKAADVLKQGPKRKAK